MNTDGGYVRNLADQIDEHHGNAHHRHFNLKGSLVISLMSKSAPLQMANRFPRENGKNQDRNHEANKVVEDNAISCAKCWIIGVFEEFDWFGSDGR